MTKNEQKIVQELESAEKEVLRYSQAAAVSFLIFLMIIWLGSGTAIVLYVFFLAGLVAAGNQKIDEKEKIECRLQRYRATYQKGE